MKINPKELYFGQQHIGTVQIFGREYHTIPLEETPHYQFLKGQEELYMNYLEHSWSYVQPTLNTQEKRNKKVEIYKKLLEDIKTHGIKRPVQICTRYDGKKIIVSGNHRAAIALYLGIDLPIEELSVEERYAKVVNIPQERYGTNLKNIPYQSIYYKGQEIVKGRREDIQRRMQMIMPDDIIEKKILDIGCNIGASSFLAAEMGAQKTYGYDISKKILTAAIRMNTMLALPCYFMEDNFAKEVSTPKCDTAFIFSVDQHINNNIMLAKNIKRNVQSVVYFECHEKADIPKEIKVIFSNVEWIGYTGNNNRRFYRCLL